ncbi:unnamed protein product [Rotaria socialis]|uniref:Uncharacterized protein n=1 Tax=Rotaria socialis TaxID=392032 RepID=A0A820SWD6_9BILA|nr:unnamed protein product [Rotaria socialis]CAF4459474.1 unnamed protein product [Rotaria socialis]
MLRTLLLLLSTTIISVSMLVCYDCPLRHYGFLLTPDNIPIFTDCTTTITTGNFCSLNIYSDDNGKTSKLRANPNMGTERANVSYILTGFDVPKSFDEIVGFGILYQCMNDNCNNPQMILKRILQASKIETYKPPQLQWAVDQSSPSPTLLCSTFSNFTSIDECRPPFHVRESSNSVDICSTYCVTAIRIDPVDLKTESVCSYCEQETTERFLYIDERIHLLDKRISYLQQLDYLCNTSNYCNSLDNIRQIQQRYKIEFDFDIFFGSDSTTMMTQTTSDMTMITKVTTGTPMITTTRNSMTMMTMNVNLQLITYSFLILSVFLE